MAELSVQRCRQLLEIGGVNIKTRRGQDEKSLRNDFLVGEGKAPNWAGDAALCQVQPCRVNQKLAVGSVVPVVLN